MMGGWGRKTPVSGNDFAFQGSGRPDIGRLDAVLNVDVEGAGEILRITAAPTVGYPRHRVRRSGVSLRASAIRRCRRPMSFNAPVPPRQADRAYLRRWAGSDMDAENPRHIGTSTCAVTFFVVGENALEHPACRADRGRSGESAIWLYAPNMALDKAMPRSSWN